jgi:ribosomal protein L17
MSHQRFVNNAFLVGSLLLTGCGIWSFTRTSDNPIARSLALSISVAGGTTAIGCVMFGSLYSAEAEEKIKQSRQKYESELSGKQYDLERVRNTLEEIRQEKLNLERQLEKHLYESNFEIEKRDTAIQILNQKIKTVEAEYLVKVQEINHKLETEDNRVQEFLINFKQSLYDGLINKIESLEILYAEIERKLNDENFTAVHPALAKRLDEIQKIYDKCNSMMRKFEFIDITSYDVMLEYFWEITNDISCVKVRYRNSLNSATQQRKEELENLIINSVSHERAKATLKEYSEFQRQQLDDLITKVNETNTEWEQLKDALLKDLEVAHLEIDKLNQQIAELQKPLLAIGDSTYARTANTIAMYYFDQYKYKLDVIHWEENETGYSILFATRRNPGLTEKELLPENTIEQLAAFTNSLQGTLPKITFNYQHSTVTLDVTLRKPVKKEQAKGDIDKIWIPVDRFESYVKNWERIRITAGSTGGKSPTAKNLALAIMKSRKGQGEIRLYDPQHGSKKDYWDMPKRGTSHEDNVTGMGELCDELDSRTKQPGNHPFILYIFDEVDSTIAQERESNSYYYFRDKVTYSLKQASHQNIGAIYIGQACDASTIPGMSWSDWNNAIQLHIGANAGIWLDKAKTITAEDKTRLLEQYRKIQEYCDRKNEELGLDVFTDPAAYRFALAVPLTGLPKFIQLPDFDSYDYWEVMSEKESAISTNTQNPVISNILNEVQNEVKNDVLKPVIVCHHCGSTNWKRHSAVKDPNQYRYLCKNPECKKTFVDRNIN